MLENLFGDPNKRYLNKIKPIVDKINELESEFEHFSKEELKNKTNEFKAKIQKTKISKSQQTYPLQNRNPRLHPHLRKIALLRLWQQILTPNFSIPFMI